MANYYCDHGAYPAYAAIPSGTFGANAQEGDGKATGLANPSVGKLLINAVAVAGNTITVGGVTLTAVASGASAVQFNVGATTSLQADNIATAINAATTAVSANVASGSPQLRNLMYARGPTAGAAANTVEIMTRCGSADFNNATNATYWTLATSGWGTPPTLTQWIGGTSGVWGYLFNTAAIWPSSIAVYTYGAYGSGASSQPMHGPATLDLFSDFINVRCRGVTITMPGSTSYTVGRDGANYVFDGGIGSVAAWNGDSGALTINNSGNFTRTIRSGVKMSERAEAYGKYVFGMDQLTSHHGTFNTVSSSCELTIDGVRVVVAGSFTGAVPTLFNVAGGSKCQFLRSKVELPLSYTTTHDFFTGFTSENNELTIDGCEFIFAAQAVPASSALVAITSSTAHQKAVIRNTKVTGLPSPMRLFTAAAANQDMVLTLIGDSCEGFDVSGTVVGLSGLGRNKPVEQQYMLLYNQGAKRGMTFECTEGYVQWWPGLDIPTFSALLPDGSAWALRWRWLSHLTNGISPSRPFTLWRTSQTVISSGKTTVTIELLLDPAYASAITKGHIGLDVGYISNVTSSL